MSPALSVLYALGSALLVGFGSVLQHRAGTHSPTSFWRTFRQPLWLVGAVTGIVGFALHVLALSAGALAVVQPLLVTGLVFALPLSRLLDKRAIHVGEVLAAGAVVAGLVVFQFAAHARAGSTQADSGRLVVCAVVTAAVIAVGLVVAFVSVRCRVASLGFCSGAGFGMAAALLKAGIGRYDADGSGVLRSWPLWAFVVVVLASIALGQYAFNSGPIAQSLPLITIVDPLVSVAVGAFAFAETPAASAAQLVAQLGGFVAMGTGVVVLARLGTGTSGVPVADVDVAPSALVRTTRPRSQAGFRHVR